MIEIIPVIDIKKGKAVRAYKGEREKYKEIGEVLDIAENIVRINLAAFILPTLMP